MNFQWLQFWGDLRQGLHPSWQDHLPAATAFPHRDWQHRHRACALHTRRALGVADQWDAHFSPSSAPWMLRDEPAFARWCEACGLLALGDHLKRLVSVRAVERLQIGLDRRTLARIIEFIRDQTNPPGDPLPLDIPAAANLGAHTLQRVCAPLYPQVWSRLGLRFERTQPQREPPATPPFMPDFDTLCRLDTFLFGPARPRPEDEAWTPSPTRLA